MASYVVRFVRGTQLRYFIVQLGVKGQCSSLEAHSFGSVVKSVECGSGELSGSDSSGLQVHDAKTAFLVCKTLVVALSTFACFVFC